MTKRKKLFSRRLHVELVFTLLELAERLNPRRSPLAGQPYISERRRLPAWRVSMPLLIFPGVISLALVGDAGLANGFIHAVPLIALLGFLACGLAIWRGARISDKFALLLVGCFVLSAALVLPALGAREFVHPFMAAATLYGICLAIYTVLSSSLYLVLVNFQRPQRIDIA